MQQYHDTLHTPSSSSLPSSPSSAHNSTTTDIYNPAHVLSTQRLLTSKSMTDGHCTSAIADGLHNVLVNRHLTTTIYSSVLLQPSSIVLSTSSWCCPSRMCVVFLACVHLALFLALSLSAGNSLVSSWCDHGMLASFCAWQSLIVPSLLQLCWGPITHLFSSLSTELAVSSPVLSSLRRQDILLCSFLVSSFHSRTLLQVILALSLDICESGRNVHSLCSTKFKTTDVCPVL